LAATDLTATIEVIDPNAIILEGDGNTFFMNQPASQLDGIQLIDIRGTGNNTLMLDAARIADTFAGGEILVVSDSGDQVVFDDGWDFNQAFAGGGRLIRQFVHNNAVLNLTGPDDFSNPIDIYDVNASGDVSALDALQVINELGRRTYSDPNSSPSGQIRDLETLDLTSFRFYDVTADFRISALDALRVINELGRRSNSGSGEAVVIAQADEKSDAPIDRQWQSPAAAIERVEKRVGGFELQQATRRPPTDQPPEVSPRPEAIPTEMVDAAIESMWLD
jgi:Ca2+-binding EF-hand superfamily protein